jgi:hypothetical protein
MKSAATTTDFCSVFEARLGIRQGTAMLFAQRLRKDQTLLRRGRAGRGAVDLTAQEVANWLIALCAATSTARKGPDAIATVKLARSAARVRADDIRCPPAALEGLGLASATTFGEAIDSLFTDMRTGAYARWHGVSSDPRWPVAYVLRIRFINNAADIIINTMRFRDDAAQEAVLVFRAENHPGAHWYNLNYTVELNGFALEALAATLGPLEPREGAPGCTAALSRPSP